MFHMMPRGVIGNSRDGARCMMRTLVSQTHAQIAGWAIQIAARAKTNIRIECSDLIRALPSRRGLVTANPAATCARKGHVVNCGTARLRSIRPYDRDQSAWGFAL